MDQYRPAQESAEQFVFSPTTIPRLEHYYKSLPRREGSKSLNLAVSGISLDSPAKSAHDPSSCLPLELVALIVHHTDIQSVYNLRRASQFAAQVLLDDVFWKKRILGDMPWLYDLPVGASLEANLTPVDWAQVYRHLLRASDTAYAERVLGLVNRRRIWGMCGTISSVYMSKKPKMSIGSGESRVLAGAKSTPLSLLVIPDPKDTTSTHVALLNDYRELLHEEPVVSVSWTEDGCLENIECGTLLEASTKARQNFAIPQDDWITGVITTSECFKSGKDDETKRRVIGIRFLFAKAGPYQTGPHQRRPAPYPGHG
jgi:hypothetical protein